jgi:hypothetical protein
MSVHEHKHAAAPPSETIDTLSTEPEVSISKRASSGHSLSPDLVTAIGALRPYLLCRYSAAGLSEGGGAKGYRSTPTYFHTTCRRHGFN